MTRASNVIPIGFNPSPLRATMMSADTGYTVDTLSTVRHPPTQFFHADDILRNSVGTTNRDTHYSERDTMYSRRDTAFTTRDSMRDSSYTTAGHRSAAIIAPAPVPVAVRAQPKIVTFGKRSSSQPGTPGIPAVPPLTAEKVAEAERSLAASKPHNAPSVIVTEDTASVGSRLDVPAENTSGVRVSTSTKSPSSKVVANSVITTGSPFDDETPESPVLGEAEADSLPSTPQFSPHDYALDSPINPSIFDDPHSPTAPTSGHQI
jgi:hypothetical protein